MPLRDHFHPPLSVRRNWTSFHSTWAGNVAKDLNRTLPRRYYAEPLASFGLEIDVATWENEEDETPDQNGTPSWTPPEPSDSIPVALLTDNVEVLVHREAGPDLAAAIEFVSPANKDRPASRAAFVNKCAAYVQQGVGVIIVDIVTERRANLHRELVMRLADRERFQFPGHLYVSAYRPLEREEQICVDIFQWPLRLNRSLPTVPLWILRGPCMAVDLEATYERSCEELRMPSNRVS